MKSKCHICQKVVKESCPIRTWTKDGMKEFVFHDKCFEKNFVLKDGKIVHKKQEARK